MHVCVIASSITYIHPVDSTGVQTYSELSALTTRLAVSNLIIDWANIGDKKSWRASFVFENQYISRITSYHEIKEEFSVKITCPAGILKNLSGH